MQSWWEQPHYRRLWREMVAARTEYPASRFKGRGLVFCISEEDQFEKLWVNLCLSRRVLNCSMPIEIWHFGQRDLMARASALLDAFSVRIVSGDAFSRELPANTWSEYALKALSIAHSSFEDALFLDVDSYPVRDPASLFDELAYRWSGAIFWPDTLRTDPDSKIWSLLDIPFVDEYQWSSSQLVVNKNRAWRPLSLLNHLIGHHGFYDPHMRGGKFAFYAAWKTLDQPHGMTRQAAQCIGAPDGEGHVNQFDLQGRLLFQGSPGAGWTPSPGGTEPDSRFVHQEACEAFSEELRERWSDSGGRPGRSRPSNRKRPPLWKCLQASLQAPARMETPLPRSCSETETWDAMTLALLRSPNLVSPSAMGVGIEALSRCSEKEARAIFRLFAALVFVDPRLAAMLPQDLDVDETALEEPWDCLVSFVRALQSQNGRFCLIGVRGDFLARGAAPLLTAEEKVLVMRLNNILAECETDTWREWLESWGPVLAEHVAGSEEIVTPTRATATRRRGDTFVSKPWHGKVRDDTVLILTPIKDAADLAESYCSLLARLNYPPERLSLGMLESDSLDGTYDAFDQALSSLRRRWRRVELWKHDLHYRIPAGLARWEMTIQLRRRQVLAQSRNELLRRALKDEDWALWLDVDVIDYPHDIIEQLLSYGKDILHPHCVFDYGGRTFDRNAWREQGRVDMGTVRGRELLAPLDAVGGTMLLVRADLHRKGLFFPAEPYGQGNPRIRQAPNCHDPARPGELETEGLGIMASDMNVQCWGLPELEILHRKR